MLIDMLKASGMAPECTDTVFDMSVGYDLAGISSRRCAPFSPVLIDASPIVARLADRNSAGLGSLP